MKKLLILTYYFPPLGLGGTQRVAKFVKYLPQFGWSPTVVTVKPIAYWALDESLLADVHGARIIRTESFDPQRLMARFGRTEMTVTSAGGRPGLGALINQKILPFFLVPDSKILWRSFAITAAKKLLARSLSGVEVQESFDALLTSAPPHSTHIIGYHLARKFKLKWLADFRDAWAGSHIVHEPTILQFRRNVKWQKKVVNAADAVVTVSPGTEQLLQAGVDEPGKFFLIPNGYDPDDFVTPASANERYTLCYSGTINKFADPAPFLDALALLRQNDPALVQKLRVQFVGLDTLGNFAGLVQARKLGDVVEIIGHKNHAESVRYVNHADGLLLIANARATDTFIPGKTFEYIGARKPIFAISNSRFTNDLLRDYPLALIVDSLQPEKIYAAFNNFFTTNWNDRSPDPGFIGQFNRKLQTGQLAEILNSLTRK